MIKLISPDESANTANSDDNVDDDAMPVPQVKVGPDGSIIIDESSTMIETSAAKRAKEDFMKSPLVSLLPNRCFLSNKLFTDFTECFSF
jgi:hypothetical protein